MKTTILLADDHPVLCSGLRMEISKVRRWKVVGRAASGPEAVRLARELAPDLVIMESRLPQLDCQAVIRGILGELPGVKILVFASDAEFLPAALAAGAAGYVLKSSPVAALLDAIDRVASGRVSTTTTGRVEIVEHGAGPVCRGRPRNGVLLSEKEKELLRLLAAGKRSKEIAPSVDLSLSSVETYRLRIKRKLGCQSTAELVRYAIAHRIADAGVAENGN